MNGASREALAAARERLDALTDSTSVDAASSPTSWPPSPRCSTARSSLRRVLTDPAQAGEAKADWSQRLLGDQVGGPAADLVVRHGPLPLVAPRDLVDARRGAGGPRRPHRRPSGPARSTTSRTSCSASAGSSASSAGAARRADRPHGHRRGQARSCCVSCWAAGPSRPPSVW